MSDKKLTREQANELYDSLQKAMTTMFTKKGQKTPESSAQNSAKAVTAEAAAKAASKTAYSRTGTAPKSFQSSMIPRGATSRMGKGRLNGNATAVVCLAFFCCAKVGLSALEATGVGRVEPVEAAVMRPLPKGPQWSKEEVKILTALDSRRVELEERGARIEQRESDFVAKERELALRLTELKELSDKLKTEREKGDKQRGSQLEQLANVYGSMNPPEAAHLLEQLDIQVSLSLIERMPEKRIGQILALMNPQRALELTNMLSQRKG
jgi:flagellar motility protein MotE (MotC chaperone)